MNWTRADKYLVAAMIVLNLALFTRAGSARGDWVVIEVDQQEVARLPLAEARVFHVQGKLGVTEVEIGQGKARIVKSPCKNKICIKSGYIRYADRLAACLPNRVVVRVVGETHRGVDSVVG